jgi:hypothetical protein
MRKTGFPLAPVILGLVLGPLMEKNLRRALALSGGEWSVMFSSPLAITLWVLAISALVLPWGTEVLVVGHTDSVGSDAYNQGLSERRAASARSYLIGAGLESGRVRAVGMGENEPIASNDTDAGRQQNRRVEIAIFASEEMQAQMLRRHGG